MAKTNFIDFQFKEFVLFFQKKNSCFNNLEKVTSLVASLIVCTKKVGITKTASTLNKLFQSDPLNCNDRVLLLFNTIGICTKCFQN